MPEDKSKEIKDLESKNKGKPKKSENKTELSKSSPPKDSFLQKKPSGIFASIDSGIDKIKGAFSKGGVINNIVKIAKITGLAALGVGGFVVSEKLKLLGAVEDIQETFKDLNNGEGIAKKLDPSYAAETKEPIKIPEKGEIQQPIPEGDSQAKSDNRKAQVEKVSATAATKIALENASRMNQLTKRTQEIMSNYGVSSLTAMTPQQPTVNAVSTAPSSEVSNDNSVSTQEVLNTYQFNGGNMERLLAANNELLGIISQQIEVIHSTSSAGIANKMNEAQLLQSLAERDDKEAKKIQEHNNAIESVSDVMMKNAAEAENKTIDRTKNRSDGQKAGKKKLLSKSNLGEALGDLSKLAIPLLIKKAYDIMTDNGYDESRNEEINKKKLKDKDGNDYNEYFIEGNKGIGHYIGDVLGFLAKYGIALFKTINPIHLANTLVQSLLDLIPEDSWLGKIFKGAGKVATFGLQAADLGMDKLGDAYGYLANKGADLAHASSNETVTDEEGNVYYANDEVMKKRKDKATEQNLEIDHKTGFAVPYGTKKDENGNYVSPTLFKWDNDEEKWIEKTEGPSGADRKPSKPARSSNVSVKNNVRGVGKTINIDDLAKGQKVGFSGKNDGPDTTDVVTGTAWSAADAVTTEIQEPPEWTGDNAQAGAAAAQAMMDLDSKIVYSQTGGRNPYGGDHTSDCSSTVQWAMKKTTGIDPGFNTVAQIMNKNGVWVDRSNINIDGTGNAKIPDESRLKPGDLLFFRPNNPAKQDKSRPYRVGHVEMYVGNHQMMGQTGEAPGHKGPVYHTIGKHAWLNNGYIGAKRFILPDGNANADAASGKAIKINSAQDLDNAVEAFKNQQISNSKAPVVTPATLPSNQPNPTPGFSFELPKTKQGAGAVPVPLAPQNQNYADNRVTDNRATYVTNNNDNKVVNNYYNKGGNPDYQN